MSIKSTVAAIALAATSLLAAPVEASVENTAIRRGRVAGFNVVVTDTPTYDTIVVPFEETFPGIVLVRCSTGDYRFNDEIGRASAHKIATEYCH